MASDHVNALSPRPGHRSFPTTNQALTPAKHEAWGGKHLIAAARTRQWEREASLRTLA